MSGSNASDLAGEPQDRRKLIAVVYADMVGYSRLIGLDDAGTLERMRSIRRTVIDPAIEKHGGRIVQTGGDSLLIVFDSIDGAVRCAVKVQHQVPTHDGDQPADRAIRFRVGINIGDAIADGTDLHGDAVNVAARIQAESPPGGICVTRAVRDHMRGWPDLTFEELGPLELKNIDHPVEAYVLRLEVGTTQSPLERTLADNLPEALPRPGKPSVAVLAFTNMSDDLDQEYFSDGIAEDIITELSRSHSLFVVARNSSFSYKGRAVDVKRVARELGVRYMVEGSVRRSGRRIRVTAQLIDAETGNHVWAERYDRPLEDVFTVQDEITVAVTSAILPAMADAEQRRALRKLPESLDAWAAYMRGLWHHAKFDLGENENAKTFFQRAIDLDASFSPPYWCLAYTYVDEAALYFTRPLGEALALAEPLTQKSLALDASDAGALAALARLSAARGDLEVALRWVEQALQLDPNYAAAFRIKGQCLGNAGRHIEAVEVLEAYLRLNPRDPRNWLALYNLTIASYSTGDYGRAVEAAKRAMQINAKQILTHRWLAAALGQMGRMVEAQGVIRTAAIALAPGSFAGHARDRSPWLRSVDHEHMLDGLRKAGWTE
jgi:adenylate cyclase